ncbi:MAG: phosphate acyltransferase PlsX [Gammaproteobacteria bacterium]|jgi:glycerol-3-phosphate acyltransferase PlsX|nr:phosphate acyltransferase PlsX [Gammaproteobacteria bacterium]
MVGSHSTISLDAMSGDLGAEVVVHAAAATLLKYRNVELRLVGNQTELQSLVSRIIGDNPRLQIIHASEVVEMAEPPVDALRKKKDSSMRIAINLVKEGQADACVSSGNTGALMATAKFVLKTLPGIDRPAIITELPAKGGSLHMLDLGANTEASAAQLFQYAMMGSIVSSDILGIAAPRIALLNIGVEDMKGNDTVRAAAALLSASTLNYVGFIEGNDLFSGKADVVVTDGFTGNVALKTIEGAVGLVHHFLKRAFTRSWFAKLQAVLASRVLKGLAMELDSRHYNGATLVGLNGIVIKSHGSADSLAFQHAIDTAIVEVRNQLPQQIGTLLQKEIA